MSKYQYATSMGYDKEDVTLLNTTGSAWEVYVRGYKVQYSYYTPIVIDNIATEKKHSMTTSNHLSKYMHYARIYENDFQELKDLLGL